MTNTAAGKTFLGALADFLSPSPTPNAPKTRLIGPLTPPGRISYVSGITNGRTLDMSRMNKETLLQIINGVDADPLAGMGAFSKKDILVDRLLAHWNTVGPREGSVGTARPILEGVSGGPPAPFAGNPKPLSTVAPTASGGAKPGV